MIFHTDSLLCNNQASYMDGYMNMLSQKRIQLAKMFLVWNTHCAKVEHQRMVQTDLTSEIDTKSLDLQNSKLSVTESIDQSTY